MQKICTIQTGVSSLAEAKILAADLIGKRLAACVQVAGSGLSVYRWKGEIEQAEEFYLAIKTTAERRDDVIEWLQQKHPYELPEIIWHEMDASAEYAGWVRAEIDAPGQKLQDVE